MSDETNETSEQQQDETTEAVTAESQTEAAAVLSPMSGGAAARVRTPSRLRGADG